MRTTRFTRGVVAGLSLAVVALVGGLYAPLAAATEAPPAGQMRGEELRTAMRSLWEDHVTWTRLYIVSVAASLPDAELAAQRLLRNQTDIGNAIKPFYGEAAGNGLTALLRDHILGAAEVLAAAKAGDQAKTAAAKQQWYVNADEIAAFLSRANSTSWPLAEMQAGMKMHLGLTLQEAVNRLQGKYADDIRDYDRIREHILGLADLLAKGLVAQFPERFAQS